MSNYLVGIGGTGQRVTTAFIQACFMNAIWDDDGKLLDQVKVLIIDKDNDSGNEALPKLNKYNDPGKGPMGKTLLENLGAWEPKPTKTPQSLAALAGGNANSTLLMGALFTEYERTTLANRGNAAAAFADGFKGHPNVGATYQDVSMEDGASDPKTPVGQLVSQITEELNAGKPVRVCIVASLFGGTGASGLPLLVQRLRKIPSTPQAHLLKIGTVMMLPYFSYNIENTTQDRIGLSQSNRQTQAALRYYQNNGYMDAGKTERTINDTYLIGLPELPQVANYCEGGSGQVNRPVFVELTAAFSIRHFFVNDSASATRAWVVDINDNEPANNVTQLQYGALIGIEKVDGKLQQTMLKALRYALFCQIYVYWGLVNWTDADQNKQFLADEAAKIWVKNTGFSEYVLSNSTKYNEERAALFVELDNMMEQIQNFLRWLLDTMWYRANINKKASNLHPMIFPGFGTDLLEALSERVEDMERAYARDTQLEGEKRPLRSKEGFSMFGMRAIVPASECQQKWESWFNGSFGGEGTEEYGGKILRRLNKAPAGLKLAEVLDLIYEEC